MRNFAMGVVVIVLCHGCARLPSGMKPGFENYKKQNFFSNEKK